MKIPILIVTFTDFYGIYTNGRIFFKSKHQKNMKPGIKLFLWLSHLLGMEFYQGIVSQENYRKGFKKFIQFDSINLNRASLNY